jgi:hypothetical protein
MIVEIHWLYSVGYMRRWMGMGSPRAFVVAGEGSGLAGVAPAFTGHGVGEGVPDDEDGGGRQAADGIDQDPQQRRRGQRALPWRPWSFPVSARAAVRNARASMTRVTCRWKGVHLGKYWKVATDDGTAGWVDHTYLRPLCVS